MAVAQVSLLVLLINHDEAQMLNRRKHRGARPDDDTRVAKICPQCGHLLLPYRVGHGLAFSIDYCGACGGVWCDRNEWDAIKARNLHDNLHDIVSAHWQNAVRRADVDAAVEQTYRRVLGDAYDKAAEVREWLRNEPRRSTLLAYLSDARRPE